MTLNKKVQGKELKFHLHLDNKKRECRLGTRKKINQDGEDDNDVSDFLDNWNKIFFWGGKKITSSREEKRKRKEKRRPGKKYSPKYLRKI